MEKILVIFVVSAAVVLGVLWQYRKRPAINVPREDVLPEELKSIINIKSIKIPNMAFTKVLAIVLGLIIVESILKFDLMFDSKETIINIFTGVTFGLIILSFILCIRSIKNMTKAKKDLLAGNFTITTAKLKRRYAYRTESKIKFYRFSFEGIKGSLPTQYMEYVRSRVGDEFYIINIVKYKVAYNTQFYRLTEKDKNHLKGNGVN